MRLNEIIRQEVQAALENIDMNTYRDAIRNCIEEIDIEDIATDAIRENLSGNIEDAIKEAISDEITDLL